MFHPLKRALQNTIKQGNLTLTDARGRAHNFGNGAGVPVAARFKDRKLERQLFLDPMLKAGEGYMDGRLVVERGTIYDLLETVLQNLPSRHRPLWTSWAYGLRLLTRRLRQYNPIFRAKKNVAHHYDIDGAVYDLFLDTDRQYSCGYFDNETSSLEHAQVAKKRHLAAKLRLEPGQKVLDIGSGWGGLSLYLARSVGVDVTGITLSRAQLKMSRERAAQSGLDNRVRFKALDFREISGRFDRVVSVGMFEHVGVGQYDAFFRQLRGLLDRDGVAVIHAIGRFDVPAVTNPFITRYIFPGGYIPALSEVLPAIERSGLVLTDVEILRLHYAETLRHWRERFLASWDKAAQLKGERFCRMWEFYLAGAETAFRYENLMVFQLQLCRHQTAVPLTRDYMFTGEDELRRAESWPEQPRLVGDKGQLS